MSIRETLNKQRGLGIAIGGVLIVGALAFVWYNSGGSGGGLNATDVGKAYFTTDLSSPEAAMAAMFADDADKLPPFDHNGKQAVKIHIYTPDEGKTRFVSHYERLTSEARDRNSKMAERLSNAGKSGLIQALVDEDLGIKGGREFRLPDSDKWLPSDTAQRTISTRMTQKGPQVTEVFP